MPCPAVCPRGPLAPTPSPEGTATSHPSRPGSSICTPSHGAVVKVVIPLQARFIHCPAQVWVSHGSSFASLSHLLEPIRTSGQRPGSSQDRS